MRSEFSTANRIIFGSGVSDELPVLVRPLASRIALVVSGGSAARGGPAAVLADTVASSTPVVTRIAISGEPELATIEAALVKVRKAKCDGVVAIGGGSVLDAGKALAALARNPGGILDYLELIGAARPLDVPALPLIAVPTTAGTGSEVTRNAVLRSATHRVKASLRDASMLPRIALVDPLLTLDTPPAVTAASGLDALTQLLEAFTSRRAGPLTDGMCREGLALVATHLRQAVQHGSDQQARSGMSMAALLSGIVLANAGLGAVHAIAGPAGGMLPVPHGVLCAALLSSVTAANLIALRRTDPNGESIRRYDEAAQILGAGGFARLPLFLSELASELGIQPLWQNGLNPEQLVLLAQNALQASSMRSNPVALTAEELAEAIRMAR